MLEKNFFSVKETSESLYFAYTTDNSKSDGVESETKRERRRVDGTETKSNQTLPTKFSNSRFALGEFGERVE